MLIRKSFYKYGLVQVLIRRTSYKYIRRIPRWLVSIESARVGTNTADFLLIHFPSRVLIQEITHGHC